MQVEKVSRYEIREVLGTGGMATVYRAYDPLFERDVALKVLRQELLHDAQVRERFVQEARLITHLEHPAIVPIYDVEHKGERLFFVMRYMTGGSLVERIQQRSLSLDAIARILQRVGDALDYAHNRGVVHRDVKPGNVLFDEEENAYISDFGIAKIANGSSKLSSGIIGTPTHISPEQALGKPVDGRSDLYSLGVILFEMLCGRTPFEATTPLGMAFKHASAPVPHIRDIDPGLPRGIDTVLTKALAKEPHQRYASGRDLAQAFSTSLSNP